MTGERRAPDPTARPRVGALLRACGVVPVRVVPLASGDPWRRSARTFRVEGRDGRTVKLRVGRDRDGVERLAALTAALADARVPPPLAVDRGVSVWAWVEGPTLEGSPRDADVERAAELLAWVHGRRDCTAGRVRATAVVVARAARQLEELAEAGAVTTGMRDGLGSLLSLLPPSAAWGVVHNDFCGENLVRRDDGTVVSIDHERMRGGFVDYDVARAWSRWLLPEPLEARFLASYGRMRPLPPEPELRAWRAVAVVKRLHLRHRHGVPSKLAVARAEQLLALT